MTNLLEDPQLRRDAACAKSTGLSALLAAQRREGAVLVREFQSLREVMPLLMKQRNGERWTAEEKRRLYERLRRFAHLSPYFVLLLLPGSIVLLPLYAWWLDRRRRRRHARPDDQSPA